jgi:hypothetical protein
MTPQAGQPDSVVLSTWILRWPKPGISVSTTTVVGQVEDRGGSVKGMGT